MDAWEPERPSVSRSAFARGFVCRHVQDSANPRASPSGHLEAEESVVRGVIREAREETGVLIDPADLAFSHVIHHRNPLGQARIGFFFTTTRWEGEPVNREPHKCAGLYWVDPARPPVNTVPYTAAALAAITRGASFSLDGWCG
ncbi:MAG TPA: NUDIX domain-containing protein [Streptosporangiaceae bacterium]|nr:NUDIX domain-containing protein [Streptosporangiaceae bacterium]